MVTSLLRYTCGALCAFALASPAFAADPAPPADPYVALDAAKVQLADGRLAEAARQLAVIPHGRAEAYVDEEVALQQLLLDAAFLEATHFLQGELVRLKLADSAYWRWLWQQRDGYASNFATHARRYLELTGDGYHLSFVRFRLPTVNEDHLRDVELYSDAQVLKAAVQNFEEGSQGLGEGLVLAQARVAVVLSAARHYDLPQAKTTIAEVASRLSAGVPLYPVRTLDWLADIGLRTKDAGNGLEQLSRGCDEQIVTLTANLPDDALRHRAQNRLNPPPPPKPEPVKKKKDKKKKKR